jgi:hypothetical protein
MDTLDASQVKNLSPSPLEEQDKQEGYRLSHLPSKLI